MEIDRKVCFLPFVRIVRSKNASSNQKSMKKLWGWSSSLNFKGRKGRVTNFRLRWVFLFHATYRARCLTTALILNINQCRQLMWENGRWSQEDLATELKRPDTFFCKGCASKKCKAHNTACSSFNTACKVFRNRQKQTPSLRNTQLLKEFHWREEKRLSLSDHSLLNNCSKKIRIFHASKPSCTNFLIVNDTMSLSKTSTFWWRDQLFTKN